MRTVDDLPELTLLHKPYDDIARVYQKIHALGDAGIFRSPDGNGLLVTSFVALQTLRKLPQLEALRRDLNKSGTGTQGAQARLSQFTPFFVSNPLHASLAPAMHQPFSPRHQGGIKNGFTNRVKDALRLVHEKDTVDLVEDYAKIITRHYWMQELGASESMDDAFRQWSAAFIPMLAFEATTEQVHTANQAAQDMWAYLLELAQTASENSLLTRMTHCLKHLPEDYQNGANVIAAITFDGIDSAASAISNILYLVLSNDELQAALRKHPEQIDNAIREALRLEPPLPGLHRGTTSPVNYQGLEIPEGINIFMVWGCGNRDPNVYDEPDAFKLERQNLSILSFGGGKRFCKGRTLAMVQCKVALEELLASTTWIELLNRANWSPPGSIRTVEKLKCIVR